MNISITNRPFMILFCLAFLSFLTSPFFADSYEVNKHKINTAISNCMTDYTNNPFGSEAYKAGCSKCIGLGMAMMDAGSSVHVDRLDYQMMIDAPECRGLKVKAIKPSLPDSWLVRIPKILLLLSFAMLFISNWPLRHLKKKLSRSNQYNQIQE